MYSKKKGKKKNFFLSLGVTTAALATDAAIKKLIYGLGITTISKKKMKDIME